MMNEDLIAAKNAIAVAIALITASCASIKNTTYNDECLARGALEHINEYQGQVSLSARFNELNSTDQEKKTFFKHVLDSGAFDYIKTCRYGQINKATNISVLKPEEPEGMCMEWPYQLQTSYAPRDKDRFDTFVKTVCGFEIKGAIEVNKFEVYGYYHPGTPSIVTPPPVIPKSYRR